MPGKIQADRIRFSSVCQLLLESSAGGRVDFITPAGVFRDCHFVESPQRLSYAVK